MNNDVFKGKWKQMPGQAKVWWDELTYDNQLELAASSIITSPGSWKRSVTFGSRPAKIFKKEPNGKLL